MWYQDLGGRKPRIFNMADHLCGGFHAKLAGVDVNGSQLGEMRRANSELLKERMERSAGIESPVSVQMRSRVSARISSLTTMAVGRLADRSSACTGVSSPAVMEGSSTQYSGFGTMPWRVSASW